MEPGRRRGQAHHQACRKWCGLSPAPLANIDKITIVSTGDGEAAGMHKITGDLTKIAAQIPALFETLSGMQMSELLGKVRTIGDKAPKPGNGSGTVANS